MKVAKNFFIRLILLYQKYISPHKGYSCAYSALHGKTSCSSWAIHIIERQGLYLFTPLMIRRFQACNQAHETLEKSHKKSDDTVDPCPCTDKPIADCCLGCGLGIPFSWF